MKTNGKNFLAFDLGAESGRAVGGCFDGERLSLQEIHRFANGPTRIHDHLYWNALNLLAHIKEGLAKSVAQVEGPLTSLGLDTWGVDFGLLDKNGELIGNPYHYRDSHTDGMVEKACKVVPRSEIFAQTGIQIMQINTLYQLLALAQAQSPALEIADSLLMMPDLFNYWLTGQKRAEYTIASTSQCFNMQAGQWATDLLTQLGLPTSIFEEVVQPGTQIGSLLPDLVTSAGLQEALPVIASGCHDTASAVAAVPVATENANNFAYISSGTWSLVGVELPQPVINEQSLAYNFTNEGGVQNSVRLLKNLGGLWLVQECRRIWATQGEKLSYADLTHLATESPPFGALVDPDDPTFLAPGDMPARLADFCSRTGQTPPHSQGAFIRCALESLALKYRWAIERSEELSSQVINIIHIVGGGTQNRLLNQFTANATGRPVVTGPIEATAIGNILIQMLAMGQISSLSEGRDIVRRSFPVETYQPEDGPAWEAAYERFVKLIGK